MESTDGILIKHGVSKFEGAIFSKWYAWAQIEGGRYLESPNLYFIKWRARREIPELVRRLTRDS